MAKKFKGENTKVAAAKQKKALVADEKTKSKLEEMEKKEQKEWAVGSKDTSKKEREEIKRLEKLEKKQQAIELLKKEEATIISGNTKPRPTKLFLKSNKPTPAIRGEEKKAVAKQDKILAEVQVPTPSFSASGIDSALDLFDALSVDVADTSSDISQLKKNSTVGNLIDRHPERRAKAAYKAYEDRELQQIRADYPGLRLQQHKDILWKNWLVSPENPFNQSKVAFNATQDEIKTVAKNHAETIKNRLASN
ncbi:hypothetical protein BB561_000721 [Smittium simulii]|uniref:HMG box domain-containing protein n=1 Tax=Smittium simulii TaxID=133385 RepID=A0A2T9YXX5_9FUNG|nr:hypothetical protein BB561_000721 [Smittium simulii]